MRAAAGVLAAALAVACTAPNARDGSASPSVSPSAGPRPTSETFEIGGYPNGIAYSHGSLWVGDPEASELLRVDPVTGTIAERISAGDGSFLVAASGGDLWVSEHLAGTVSRFEPLDGSLVQTNPCRRLPDVRDRPRIGALCGRRTRCHRPSDRLANRPSRDRAPVQGRAREHRVHARDRSGSRRTAAVLSSDMTSGRVAPTERSTSAEAPGLWLRLTIGSGCRIATREQ